MTGAFAPEAYAAAFATGQEAQPVAGGGHPWRERLSESRRRVEERIRKARDDEVEQTLAELRAEGVLPPLPVDEPAPSMPDPRAVAQVHAWADAQRAGAIRAMEARMRQQAEDEEQILMLLI